MQTLTIARPTRRLVTPLFPPAQEEQATVPR